MGMAICWLLGLLVDDESNTVLPSRDRQDIVEARHAHKSQVVLSVITETPSLVQGKAISS